MCWGIIPLRSENGSNVCHWKETFATLKYESWKNKKGGGLFKKRWRAFWKKAASFSRKGGGLFKQVDC
jgi:hypothetical protein